MVTDENEPVHMYAHIIWMYGGRAPGLLAGTRRKGQVEMTMV